MAVDEVERCRQIYKGTEAKLLQKTTDAEMDRLLDDFKVQHNDLNTARRKLSNVYQKRIDVSNEYS